MFHRKAKEQWRGFIILLAMTSSFNLVKAQRLAQQKCEEYQLSRKTRTGLIPLVIHPTPIMFESFNCSNIVRLVAGGEQPDFGEFPHHALLGYSKGKGEPGYEFRCGGTLISDLHVMTAAHCFGKEHPTVVRLGEYDTASTSEMERDFDIAAVRKHPNFNHTSMYHDIALVKLATRVRLTAFIRPACLWDTEDRNITQYIATGFGVYETGSFNLSPTMRKVRLNELPVEDCADQFRYDRHFRGIQDGQLCVGSKVEGRDTCEGDSGGPLQTVTNTKTCTYHVVGITSKGSWCGVGAAKAIYTKVSRYIDWIEDNVWGPNSLTWHDLYGKVNGY